MRWQTTAHPLRAARACLAPCTKHVEPGASASRDASAGLVAGHGTQRPVWLQFQKAHPFELLVLAAASAPTASRFSLPTPELW